MISRTHFLLLHSLNERLPLPVNVHHIQSVAPDRSRGGDHSLVYLGNEPPVTVAESFESIRAALAFCGSVQQP